MNGRSDGTDRSEPRSEVRLVRGERVESRHALHAALARPFGPGAAVPEHREEARDGTSAGAGEARVGNPDLGAYWRSSMKPFQALPLVADGAAAALALTPAEIAVCCASHAGTREHVELVAGLLEKLGLTEDRLHCDPHRPFDTATARATLRAGEEYRRLHNNCSGKHAGMLALALHHGWPLEGYARFDHPVQERIRRELGRWLDPDPADLAWGTDGCGVPTPWLSVRDMARAWARLGWAARSPGGGPPPAGAPEPDDSVRAVASAMREHPEVVAGPGRLTTRLMRATEGRLLVKEGAEGVLCLTEPGAGWGLALKVGDGSRRAVAPAAVELLAALDLLRAEERERLSDLRRKTVENVQGERVGVLSARLEIRRTRSASGAAGRIDADLSPSRAALVEVSAALASGAREPLRAALRRAEGRAETVEIEEALLQSYLFAGFPAALTGLAHWRALGPPAPAEDAESDAEREAGSGDSVRESGIRARGEELCRTVYGDSYEKLRHNVRRLHPAMDRWMVEEGYGKVLGRSGLKHVDRELCAVAALAVSGHESQLYSHLRGALNAGAEESEVEAALEVGLRMRRNADGAVGADPADERARELWRRVRERA